MTEILRSLLREKDGSGFSHGPNSSSFGYTHPRLFFAIPLLFIIVVVALLLSFQKSKTNTSAELPPNTPLLNSTSTSPSKSNSLQAAADQSQSGDAISNAQSVHVSNGSNGATVTVNGQKQQLSPDGTYHKSEATNNSRTDINISVDGSSSSTNNSSTNIQIDSQSNSSGSTGMRQNR